MKVTLQNRKTANKIFKKTVFLWGNVLVNPFTGRNIIYQEKKRKCEHLFKNTS